VTGAAGTAIILKKVSNMKRTSDFISDFFKLIMIKIINSNPVSGYFIRCVL